MTTKRWIIALTACLPLVAGIGCVSPRELLVFGDANVFDNVAANDANNIRLYKSLVNFTAIGPRAHAKKVLVHLGHSSMCAPSLPACFGNAPSSKFEVAMTGEGYTVTEGDDATAPLTAIDSSVKVIFLYLPTTTYSPAEIVSLKNFVASSGRLVLIGEGDVTWYTRTKPVVNDVLQRMGSAMQNTNNWIDCATSSASAYSIVPSTSLRPHQITSGLKQLTLMCASEFQLAPGDSAIVYDRTGKRPLVVSTKITVP